MRHVLRLRQFFVPYRKSFFLALMSVIGAGAFVMVSPLLVRYAINFGLKPTYDGKTVVGLDGNEQFLIFGALSIVALAVGQGLSAFGQQYLGESIGQRLAYDIRNRIYDNLQRLSFAYHDKAQTGQIMSRVTQDVEALRMFVNMGLLRLVYIFLIIGISVAGMFIIDWKLAIASVFTLPFLAISSYYMAKKQRPLWMEIQQNQAVMTQVAEEGLTGIRVVKAFSKEPFESQKFRDAATGQAALSYRSSVLQGKFQPTMMGVGAIQMAVTVGVGSWLVSRGSITAADVLTFALWLGLLQLPVRTIGFSITFLSRAEASAERIFELLDAQSAVQERPGAKPLTAITGHVRFEDVSFGYDNLSAVLSKIDIDAQPGQIIALLGPTGSGKSTVVNLIPRFYDITGGRITIDGTDIRDVTLDSLRSQIGIVQQDVFLFIGTIRENIAYGKPDATQVDIENAAKAARIHDFIMSLPLGYDEWVGERGVTLSGGQKQRIAIARTLLLDPRILIFDDSTASVDSQTEYLIQQALQELMKGRTTFVIAQRLRTVRKADQIFVLERGKVKQHGRHEDLIHEDGLYQRIFELELQDQEEALGELRAQEAATAAAATLTPAKNGSAPPSEGPRVAEAVHAGGAGGGA